MSVVVDFPAIEAAETRVQQARARATIAEATKMGVSEAALFLWNRYDAGNKEFKAAIVQELIARGIVFQQLVDLLESLKGKP
jgi:hypothetical protein